VLPSKYASDVLEECISLFGIVFKVGTVFYSLSIFQNIFNFIVKFIKILKEVRLKGKKKFFYFDRVLHFVNLGKLKSLATS
jgi:hypothetical protein